jgi:hypothetical protein
MKLNSQQTAALAQILAVEINKKNDAFNKLAYDKFKKDNEPKLKKAKIELQNIKDQARKLITDFSDYYLEQFVKERTSELSLKSKFIKVKPHVSPDTIKQELILASIEATDLESIKSAIIKKFS